MRSGKARKQPSPLRNINIFGSRAHAAALAQLTFCARCVDSLYHHTVFFILRPPFVRRNGSVGVHDSCFDVEFFCAHIAHARPCVHVCVRTCTFLMKITVKNFVHFRESRVTLVSDAWHRQSLCEAVRFGVTMAGNSSLEALPMGLALANFFSIIIHVYAEKGQVVKIVWWRTVKVSIEICSWQKPDYTYLWWTGIMSSRPLWGNSVSHWFPITAALLETRATAQPARQNRTSR